MEEDREQTRKSSLDRSRDSQSDKSSLVSRKSNKKSLRSERGLSINSDMKSNSVSGTSRSEIDVNSDGSQPDMSIPDISILSHHTNQDSSITKRQFQNSKDLTPLELGKLTASVSDIDESRTLILSLLEEFRTQDLLKYSNIISKGVKGRDLRNLLSEMYLQIHRFPENSMIFLLNSYDEIGLARLFVLFYLEFDNSNDKRMQEDELENCVEFLAQDEYIGKEKMIAILKVIGVDASTKLGFLQEGSAAMRVLNDETRSELFQILKFKSDKSLEEKNTANILNLGKALFSFGNKKSDDYIDFGTFLPYLVAFFFETQMRSLIKKRKIFKTHLGFPYKVDDDGKERFDPDGPITGLYRTFVMHLKGESDINKEILTYRIVCKVLVAYRSSGYCDSITLEALERIMKKVREMMEVDIISGVEEKKFSLKELLPFLVAQITTEST